MTDAQVPKRQRVAALKYSGAGAPRVVAKGEGIIASKIEEIANLHEIPLIQDVNLTNMLSRVPLGDEIPENLYLAVAEVLAHIYQIRGMIDSSE